MKKITLTIVTLLAVLIVFQSCRKEEENYKHLAYNFNEITDRVALKTSTKRVSDIFFNAGVVEVLVSKRDKDKFIYNFQTKKYFYINGEKVDFKNIQIIFDKNFIYLKNDPKFKMSLIDNKPFVVSNNYVGFPKPEFYHNSTFNILLLFLNEMITVGSDKEESEIKIQNKNVDGGCSFWNTYYVYGTGVSQNAAEANLQSEIGVHTGSGGLVEGCTPLGGSNSGCMWEEFGCVAMQAYCC